jgi:glycosyltransferase involved in cell wall biosynthesis
MDQSNEKTRTKRILLISHQLDFSGAPFALLSFARALRYLGHQVQLATLKPGPLEAAFSAEGVEVSNRTSGIYDLILGNTVLSSSVLPKLRKKTGVIATWIHESPTFYRYHAALAFSNIAIDALDCILGVAAFQVNELQKIAKGKSVARFDNTHNLSSSQLAGKPEPGFLNKEHNPLKICIIGGAEKRKGLYRLEKLAALPSPDRKINFTVIGNSVENITAPISSLNLRNIAIDAPGILPRKIVLDILKESDLCLCLSEDEVKPLTIIESLSVGTPVIATKIPAHLELSAEFDSVVCTDDPIAHIVNRTNSDQSIVLDENNKFSTSIYRYSWESFLYRTELLLELLIS